MQGEVVPTDVLIYVLDYTIMVATSLASPCPSWQPHVIAFVYYWGAASSPGSHSSGWTTWRLLWYYVFIAMQWAFVSPCILWIQSSQQYSCNMKVYNCRTPQLPTYRRLRTLGTTSPRFQKMHMNYTNVLEEVPSKQKTLDFIMNFPNQSWTNYYKHYEDTNIHLCELSWTKSS